MSADYNKKNMGNLTRRFQQIAVALITAAGLIGCCLPRPASADATTYSSTKRQFKVGILLLDSTIVTTNATQIARGPENPDPYVFYVADSRSDVKPQGWEFINPLAPATVTPDIRARWLARDAGSSPDPQKRFYTVGQKIRKDMAAYWEVSLRQTSITDLLQYDLLFITNHRLTAFTPADREKLRKMVDAGGIVWIENCGGMLISKDSPFFLEQLSFVDGAGGGTPQINQPNHPLLNSPYRLTYDELQKLGDKNYTSYMVSLDDSTLPPNPKTLVNIVGNAGVKDANGNGLPYVAAGSYGGGTVISTASDCGCGINDYIGGVNAGSGGNSGAYSGSNFSAAQTQDLKFLYNMVAWGSSSTDYRRNSRRVASSFDNVGAPLVGAFDFRNALTKALRPADIVDSRSSGLISKGAYFVAGVQNGNITVRAYDLNPLRDLDGDGNIDDGLPDLSLGLPYDEIWRWTGPAAGGAQPSPPVFASVIDPETFKREDRIFITLPDGSLAILTAFNPNASGSFTAAPVVKTVAGNGGKYDQAPRTVAPAPVVFENRVYQVEPNGLLRCMDINGNPLWKTFVNLPNGTTIKPTGSPALGFIRQTAENGALNRNSGGSTNDLMLYIPAQVQEAASANTFARIVTYWLGTRNEVVRFGNDPENNNGVVKTRVAGGIAGGPSEGQYFVALSGNDNGPKADSFIKPRVRIFSKTPTPAGGNPVTAQDNYNAGILSPAYELVDAANPISEEGRVTIRRKNGFSDYPELNGAADILVAVDYDVMYISAANNKVPTNYASNQTQIGARPNRLLEVPSTDFGGGDATYSGRSFSTPALSPEDTLFFSAQQRLPNGAANPSFPTIFAMNEQEGDFLTPTNSLMPWRFPIFNSFGKATDLTLSKTVDDVTVTDIKPLVNYLTFADNWPTSSSATRSATPEPLTNVRLIGTPITTNFGITYFLGQANSAYNKNRMVSVLMAFRSDPDITLNLPEPFDTNAGVTVEQFDLLSDQSATGSPNLVRASSNQAVSPQFTLDGDRGRVIVKNFRGGGGGFSASQSFVVKYYSREGRNERKAIIPPVPIGANSTYGQQVDATGRISTNPGGFTPLLFYYVVPGLPRSQPTLIGDFVYFNVSVSNAVVNSKAHIIAVDARPYETDATVRLGFSEPAPNVTDITIDAATATKTTNKINHVRVQTLPETAPTNTNIPSTANAEGAPVGGEGSLVINSNLGTFAFNNGVTLIADSKRLIEASADASALWTLDSTISNVIAGGGLPIYTLTPPDETLAINKGRVNQTRQGLARPTSVQRIGASDYLLADTGNNRVARVDRSGTAVWSLSKVTDPFQILASGDPLTLSEPTDLLYYTANTLDASKKIIGYEVHYIIADSGNYRIIEVASYYDANGKAASDPLGASAPGDPVVVWSSRVASDQGKRLRFQSVHRYIGAGPDDSDFAGVYGYPYITAVVSNVRVGIDGPAADVAGGSLINLRYAPFNTTLGFRNSSGNVTFAKLWTPPTSGASARTSEPAGNGTVLDSISEFTIVNGATLVTKKINNPTFFQQLNLPANVNVGNPAKTLYLLCDLDGAYALQLRTRAGKPVLDALWRFTQNEYNLINGNPATGRMTFIGFPTGSGIPPALQPQLPKFAPVSLQLLANGDYLITNGWTGRSSLFENGQFNGEVFEVKPNGIPVLATVPFTSTAVGGTYAAFSVPRLEAGENFNNVTTGLNRQVMGIGDGNTGLLEQPLFAIRP